MGWTLEYSGRVKLDDAEGMLETIKYFNMKGKKGNVKKKEAFMRRARAELSRIKEGLRRNG